MHMHPVAPKPPCPLTPRDRGASNSANQHQMAASASQPRRQSSSSTAPRANDRDGRERQAIRNIFRRVQAAAASRGSDSQRDFAQPESQISSLACHAEFDHIVPTQPAAAGVLVLMLVLVPVLVSMLVLVLMLTHLAPSWVRVPSTERVSRPARVRTRPLETTGYKTNMRKQKHKTKPRQTYGRRSRSAPRERRGFEGPADPSIRPVGPTYRATPPTATTTRDDTPGADRAPSGPSGEP